MIAEPSRLPRTLLAELGRVTAIWAYIEQDILTQTSAMAARKTGGHPVDHLRIDFKRLRQAWYGLCREYFHPKIFNETINPINVEIVRLAPFRHHAVHGTWSVRGRGKYRLSIWEQRTSLDLLEAPYSL